MEKMSLKYLNAIMLSALLSLSLSLSVYAVSAQDTKAEESAKRQGHSKPQETIIHDELKRSKDNHQENSETQQSKAQETQKIAEAPIENVVAVTSEQLANKPEDYLNKNIKFTAPFFAFSNLALDYKPAFRSSRTYLSFLVLRPNSRTPFSELKLAMLIPKEKDPNTKMLQTLKEGDIIEITGHVFASSLDEPWVDVLRLKKIANAKKIEGSDDKSGDDKDSSDDATHGQ